MDSCFTPKNVLEEKTLRMDNKDRLSSMDSPQALSALDLGGCHNQRLAVNITTIPLGLSLRVTPVLSILPPQKLPRAI